MSAKAISEARGKELLNRHLKDEAIKNRVATVTENPNWDGLLQNHPWLLTEKLVAKPDQLIKRRGKLGLIKAGVDFEGAKKWLTEMIGKDIQVGAARGKLKNFVIEPFVAHSQNEEFYMCIFSQRNEDVILFHHEGGIDIGDVDSKAVRLDVPLGTSVSSDTVTSNLLPNVSQDAQHILCRFIVALYEIYKDLHFTYLEINPLVVTDKKLYILDLAAKIDQCAEFLCKAKWGDVMEFPPPFGRDALPEEAYIADLDAKSGASLKLTVLNKEGRIWTMVAGGGASVIYADTICDLGGASELANYGEYSGAPSEMQTYEYAKTILSLMTEKRHLQGKILIIGGGIANFTNVATTFKGIVRALREYQQKLIENKVSIYVRRGGPNYQEGLRVMKELGSTLGVPIHVYGPETHMTAIVSMALGKKDIPETPQPVQTTANFLLPGGTNMQRSPMSARKSSTDSGPSGGRSSALQAAAAAAASATSGSRGPQLFSHSTKAIIWGMQQRAVQGMLDFDYVCSRDEPSVVAMMYPFTGDHRQKFYWGHKEILIPVYKNMADAMKKHPQADVLVNFASLRSAYESTIETLNYPQIRSIAIIAEGIPENLTRHLIQEANKKRGLYHWTCHCGRCHAWVFQNW